ncbi:MAG: pilin [Patescibacteria group bacterium]|jgi:hypothetical protein
MNPKKIKIIFYLPLALLFIANIFYFPVMAQSACDYSVIQSEKHCSDYGQISCDFNNCPGNPDKPAMCTSASNCECCCDQSTTCTAAQTIVPKAAASTDGKKASFTPQVGIGTDFQKGKAYTPDGSTAMIGQYIRAIYKYAIGIVGILAAVVLMIGGVMWIVAGGNATMIGEAKSWIGASLTGLLLALCSYFILATVNPALVNFKTTTIQTVTTDITAIGSIGVCTAGSKIGDSCNSGSGWCDGVGNCFGKANENEWCGDGSGQCYSAATLQTLNPKPALISGGRPCSSTLYSCYKASGGASF